MAVIEDTSRQLYPRDGDGAISVQDILDTGAGGGGSGGDFSGVNAITVANATDEASAIALANANKAKINEILAILKA